MLLAEIVMNAKMVTLTLYRVTVVKHAIVIQLEALIHHVNVSVDNVIVNQVSQGNLKKEKLFAF